LLLMLLLMMRSAADATRLQLSERTHISHFLFSGYLSVQSFVLGPLMFGSIPGGTEFFNQCIRWWDPLSRRACNPSATCRRRRRCHKRVSTHRLLFGKNLPVRFVRGKLHNGSGVSERAD